MKSPIFYSGVGVTEAKTSLMNFWETSKIIPRALWEMVLEVLKFFYLLTIVPIAFLFSDIGLMILIIVFLGIIAASLFQ